MDNVLEVYARPYDPKHPYICLDEKTLQLLAEVHDPLEMAPGQILKVDSEYERRGTAAMFVITETQTGRCAVSVRAHRTDADFAEVVANVSDTLYPDAEDVTIVLDNLNTHTLGSLDKRYTKGKADRIADRIKLVYTPVHGSWVNLVAENQISIFSKQCLTRRIDDLKMLRTNMRTWVRRRNRNPKPVKWKFSKADARLKLPQIYPLEAA